MAEAAGDFALLTTTVGSRTEADDLAHGPIEARLAACIQIIAIDSIYMWRGKIEQAEEQLLILKIRLADFADVEAWIRARHRYDVPEIVAVPLVAGLPDYLAWLSAATSR